MNSALIAVDPKVTVDSNFKNFCNIIAKLQNEGLIPRSLLISVIHPAIFSVPMKWFNEMKQDFQKEAMRDLQNKCNSKFSYAGIKVLISSSSVTEDLVGQISRYALRNNNDLIVLSSNNRSGLPYWILGSFSETASLISTRPILIIKAGFKSLEQPSKVRILIAYDIETEVSRKSLKWIASYCASSNPDIELVYVRRKNVTANKKVKIPDIELKPLYETEKKLLKIGLNVKSVVLEEGRSIAHTIVEYAESKQVWITITINSERSKVRKILLGSTSRRILKLSKNPFLNVRLGN